MIRELALFAGGGGGLLASELLGFHTVAACEIDPYARKILLARQRDGMLGKFPIWDDVRTFDGRPWRGSVDLISGGFPCKDISAAGRGAGLAGKNSGLFFEMLRIIKEVRPRFVFAENSPNLRTRGLVTVVQELDRLGYECRWCVLGAWHVGAPHKRNRMWIFAYLADSDGDGKLQQKGPIEDKRRRTSDGSKKTTNLVHSERTHCERGGVSIGGEAEHSGPDMGSNPRAPANVPTPRVHDSKKMGPSEMLRKSPCLAALMEYGDDGPPLSVSTKRGTLNPDWVAWLMGWPIGWTDLKPLETDKFRRWLVLHGKYSRAGF